MEIQVQEKVSLASDNVISIRKISGHAREGVKQTTDVNVRDSALDVIENLSDIEQGLYQVQNRSSKDLVQYPIKLITNLRRWRE